MMYSVRRLPSGRTRVVIAGENKAKVVDFAHPASARLYVTYLRVRYRARSSM